ncbi:hypothetical protein GH721_00340 [Kriegella sp. EG-1]|nr:hypothetical protein [Flavobacteriaceae bacterium EG-1]
MDAHKIAKHHEIHLKEYITAEKIELKITGIQQINNIHSLAYMVVNEKDMIMVRDALKPHRGEIYVE